MTKTGPIVLVIDDDEVMLVAIADLLEAAHFSVSCHASPAGAADVAAAEPDLVGVVLDLNMPIMRGDNVARMFLSRASLRDLPIILLSGDTPAALNAVRAKMPNMRVVAKADMEKELVPALRAGIAERMQRTGRQRGWGSEPAIPTETAQDEVPRLRFYQRLRREMEESRELWREVFRGKSQPLSRLVTALRALHGEADRQGLLQAGQLLRGMEQIGLALQQGAKLRPSAESSVQRAIDTLCVIVENRGESAKFAIDASTDALRHALELRGKHGSE